MLMGPLRPPVQLYGSSDRFTRGWHDQVEIEGSAPATRRGKSSADIAGDAIQVEPGDRIVFHYRGSRHLLVICRQGLRRDGETVVNGLPRSALHDMTNRAIFVPAGHDYRDWYESLGAVHMLFLYFDPARLPEAPAPRWRLVAPTFLSLVARLEELLEADDHQNLYFDALGTALAYELFRQGPDSAAQEGAAKGGLTPRQQRLVTSYIEDHLSEPISLSMLARLAGFSPYHFCRAFKQSLGQPPHKYHRQRRIEHAKHLLGHTSSSVTEVGLTVGYRETSSFTAAFHKLTGFTPTSYRRTLLRPAPIEEAAS